MSPDESLLEKVLETLKEVKLEGILIENAGGALQGVPVMTQDIDFSVRDTELNRKKIRLFAEKLSLVLIRRDPAVSEVITAEGPDMIVDFVFRMAPDQTFEGVRSRTKRIKVGEHLCLVADLEDILKSKKHANRPKDRAVIKLIEDTMRVRKCMNEMKIGKGEE